MAETEHPSRKRAAATPANFPCGSVAAKRHIRHAFRNSKDARTTITNFQRENSLHSMLARAFGTTPAHEMPPGAGPGRVRAAGEGEEEPLDPTPVLDFLTHLGVSRHEVHARVASALRSAIEDEVQRVPLGAAAEGAETAGHRALLRLLPSAWHFRDVPELRPVLVCVLKRLGDRTPVLMLRRLGTKRPDGAGLKNAELVGQLGPHVQRLVWEADWDAAAAADGEEGRGEGPTLTLGGSTILADLLRASVESYCRDPELVRTAELSFVGTLSERRFATKSRRTNVKDSSTTRGAGETRSTLAAIGIAKTSTDGDKRKTDAASPSSAVAVAAIKDTIGSRPKLLGALLDMLIAEHAAKGGGQAYARRPAAGASEPPPADEGAALGGATNLACSLAADVLLAFGPLPRAYESLDILARLLDGAAQAGHVADEVLAQVQGCLRAIFRPAPAAPAAAAPACRAEGPKIKLSLKAAKPASSMFPDLPADDSAYEKKLLRRVLKKAIVAMKDNDPQNLFLNPVTDDIAPGYSSIIKNPICILRMEEKLASGTYKSIDEYKHDTLLLFSNCCEYNVGPAGQWFRKEANRQEKIWKKTTFPTAKSEFDGEMTKRKKSLKRKPKAPPPLAFAPAKADKSATASTGNRGKEAKDDAVINNLTAQDVAPLPPWKCKQGSTETEVPSMQCLASMLLADPFVQRVLADRIQKILRTDVPKAKGVPVGHPVLPSLFQLLNLGRMSTQLCASKGKQCHIPDAGIQNVIIDGEDPNPSYESTRNCLPLFSKLLLDAELDRRMVAGGDLHEAALKDIVAKPKVETTEWRGTSRLYDLRAVVQGALVHLLQPGSTNETALQQQFPRFVAALDQLTDGNMLDERPFFISLTRALLRYKSKLPHSTRDLVTGSMLKWLKVNDSTSPETVVSSQLHECFMHLLNEWSSLGNLVLPRDLFLSLSEEAVAASGKVEVGQKSDVFVKLWESNDDSFLAVKEQYTRMLSSTPEARALQWKQKMGVKESNQDVSGSSTASSADPVDQAKME